VIFATGTAASRRQVATRKTQPPSTTNDQQSRDEQPETPESQASTHVEHACLARLNGPTAVESGL
jgi:hypothetical protein